MSVYQLTTGDMSIVVQNATIEGNLTVNGNINLNEVVTDVVMVEAPPIPAGGSQASALIQMNCNNRTSQYYNLYANNGTGGGLVDGQFELWSYNNSSSSIQPVLQVVPQNNSNLLPTVRIPALNVTSGIVAGLINNISVPSQSMQYIGGMGGTPTNLCSFVVPSGRFFVFCLQSIASTTIYWPLTEFAANLYLSDTTNGAYDPTVQYQPPYLYVNVAQSPRVSSTPISTGGQIWCVQTPTPITTLYLVAASTTPLNLCQASDLTVNATLLAYA